MRISDWSLDVCSSDLVVSPTLMDASIRQHHREKLIDLNGQLKPLLLEWMTVFHFARSYNASIAWFPVDQSGPEFIARIGEIECEVECKRQSEAIIDLLGRTESDALAGRIVQRIMEVGLRGRASIHEIGRASCRERVCQYV